MKTLKSFVEASNINATLIRAVVRQIGGWEDFQSCAEDVANHGANSGFNGFTYYHDTVAFTRRVRPAILEMAKDQANEIGYDTVSLMISQFSCMKDITTFEIEYVLITGKGESVQQVYNALAWYALEEVCRSYIDLKEQE